MIGHGGGRCQNAQQQFIIKTYLECILYKPVGKYQFTMACIRALVIIVYQVNTGLIFQPKHMLWVLKRTVTMRRDDLKNIYNFKLKNCVYLDFGLFIMKV